MPRDYKSFPRVHVEAALSPGAPVELDKDQANHLVNVLRLKEGDAAVLFNGIRVGEVTEVDVTPIENLCLAGVVPLLPSLAEDDDGKLLNVNPVQGVDVARRRLEECPLIALEVHREGERHARNRIEPK